MIKKIFISLLVLSICLISACSKGTESVPSLTPQQLTLLYNPRGNAVLGNPNGSVTVVEIFDYQCPYCRKMTPLIEQLVKNNPDVRVVYKEFLLFGPTSEPATRAALAAQQQGKYLAMHDALMKAPEPMDQKQIMEIAKNINLDTHKLSTDMNSSAVSQQIQENSQLADQLNITAAPVFIIANSNVLQDPKNADKAVMVVGEVSMDKLNELINQAKQN